MPNGKISKDDESKYTPVEVLYLDRPVADKKHDYEISEGVFRNFATIFWIIAAVLIFMIFAYWLPAMSRGEQYNACIHSTTADGSKFTEKQCDYFRDVVNGEYLPETDENSYDPSN